MKALLLVSLLILGACTPSNHSTVEECALHVATTTQYQASMILGLEACQAIYDQDFISWTARKQSKGSRKTN